MNANVPSPIRNQAFKNDLSPVLDKNGSPV